MKINNSQYIEYTYNNANQLTYEEQYTDNSKGTQNKETQYVYNNLGNLTEKNIETSDFNNPDFNDEEWDYGYDAYNRVTGVKKDLNYVGQYTFNMLGNRVKKYVNSGSLTIKMLYDGYDCVADYDSNTTLQRYYITPMLDENLLVYDEADTDEEYFYVHDGLGTVRQILDENQNTESEASARFYKS